MPPRKGKQLYQRTEILQSRPAFKPRSISGIQTRFDDFQVSHIQLADRVYLTPQFLPWHRYSLHIYETALQTECGYKGTTLYKFSVRLSFSGQG
ncbi:hypothetical protein BYT27DRAFT_6925757 [Phlegmacium glaucopus]|nr:hypothetical protein BYT27DRAFT_6925757 [Phlegmacium glaucopus]